MRSTLQPSYTIKRTARWLLPLIVAALWLSLLLLPALSLMACGHSSPQPTPVLPPLPSPPSVTTPLPQTPYSQTWTEKVREWRGRLTATRLMSEPSSTPGQP